MQRLIEIVMVLAWMVAVYTCGYDWTGEWERERRKGKGFPETFK